jgi:hypothetical protein
MEIEKDNLRLAEEYLIIPRDNSREYKRIEELIREYNLKKTYISFEDLTTDQQDLFLDSFGEEIPETPDQEYERIQDSNMEAQLEQYRLRKRGMD